MREIPSGALRVTRSRRRRGDGVAAVHRTRRGVSTRCRVLSPVALAWVFFYSYTKRFTRWCHLVLGVGMSIAPVGGYLAVTGEVERAVVDARRAWRSRWSRGAADSTFSMRSRTWSSIERRVCIRCRRRWANARAHDLARRCTVTTVLCLAMVGAATFAGTHAGTLYAVGVVVAAGCCRTSTRS